MTIELEARRFFCDNGDCAAETFAEQIPGVTAWRARRTPVLRELLETVALALCGPAGARLASALGIATSRSTLIRLLRALPDPEVGQVSVLGVDEFAKRKGHSYATILIDMDSHRPIDVLDDRTAAVFADWLRAHPGVQVICRDRAGSFAEGARDGAPEAIQVADRWHLWRNLIDCVEKIVTRHRSCLKDPEPAPEPVHARPPQEECALVTRTRQRYASVQEMKTQGIKRAEISRRLGLDPKTVNRYWKAAGVEELLARTIGRSDLLTPYLEHLHQRWNQGCRDAEQLDDEIAALGFPGSSRTVRRYLEPFRHLLTLHQASAPVPKARTITGWLVRHPDHLDADEQQQLTDARRRCPHLNRLHSHVAEFATMLTQRDGHHRLEPWLTSIEADDFPELQSFARGIRHDHPAVLNGLTLPHSSGAVEGIVTKIKALKRQTFGRAELDLLRKRILLTT